MSAVGGLPEGQGRSGAAPQGVRVFPHASAFAVVRRRCSILQTGVWPLVVLEAIVAREPGVQRMPIGIRAEVDVLLLHAAPQPFDEHVVQGPATAVHADAHATFQEHARESSAGELTSLVVIEDARMRLLQSLLKGIHAEPALVPPEN